MDCERRLRIIEISCHYVMDWFAAAGRGWADASHITLPILDLPPDCKVLSVTHDAWSNKLLFRCSSASFEEVKDGEQIPSHFEHCRFETAELSQREREIRSIVESSRSNFPKGSFDAPVFSNRCPMTLDGDDARSKSVVGFAEPEPVMMGAEKQAKIVEAIQAELLKGHSVFIPDGLWGSQHQSFKKARLANFDWERSADEPVVLPEPDCRRITTPLVPGGFPKLGAFTEPGFSNSYPPQFVLEAMEKTGVKSWDDLTPHSLGEMDADAAEWFRDRMDKADEPVVCEAK